MYREVCSQEGRSRLGATTKIFMTRAKNAKVRMNPTGTRGEGVKGLTHGKQQMPTMRVRVGRSYLIGSRFASGDLILDRTPPPSNIPENDSAGAHYELEIPSNLKSPSPSPPSPIRVRIRIRSLISYFDLVCNHVPHTYMYFKLFFLDIFVIQRYVKHS